MENERPLKLVAIATAAAGSGGDIYTKIVGIDEHGRAWEYHHGKNTWTKLPALPEKISVPEI